MTDLERLEMLSKSNHMQKQHEDWGYPRGWNAALEFIEAEIGKLKGKRMFGSHGFAAGALFWNVILIEQQRPQKAGTSPTIEQQLRVWHE